MEIGTEVKGRAQGDGRHLGAVCVALELKNTCTELQLNCHLILAGLCKLTFDVQAEPMCSLPAQPWTRKKQKNHNLDLCLQSP